MNKDEYIKTLKEMQKEIDGLITKIDQLELDNKQEPIEPPPLPYSDLPIGTMVYYWDGGNIDPVIHKRIGYFKKILSDRDDPYIVYDPSEGRTLAYQNIEPLPGQWFEHTGDTQPEMTKGKIICWQVSNGSFHLGAANGLEWASDYEIPIKRYLILPEIK